MLLPVLRQKFRMAFQQLSINIIIIIFYYFQHILRSKMQYRWPIVMPAFDDLHITTEVGGDITA